MNLGEYSDDELISIYSDILQEFKNRKILRTNNLVGDFGEVIAIKYYNSKDILPSLIQAEPNTKAYDATDITGEIKYAIKSTSSNITGVFWGMEPLGSKISDIKKFDFAIIVCFEKNYKLKNIYEITWEQFLKLKSWQTTQKAWKLNITNVFKQEAIKIF